MYVTHEHHSISEGRTQYIPIFPNFIDPLSALKERCKKVAPTGLEPVTFEFPYLKHSKHAQIEPGPPSKRISREFGNWR